MLTPIAIDTQTLARGCYDAKSFLPTRSEIPNEFSDAGNPWAVAASNLMWLGSEAVTRAEPRPGIEVASALLHVGAVLHAVRLPVDYREAAAAYLLSQWFNRLELAGGITVNHDEADTAGSTTVEACAKIN